MNDYLFSENCDYDEITCPFCESDNVEIKGKHIFCFRCHANCQTSIDYDYKEELL
jgi:hypothetical protein